jgi:L-fuconolactonase
MWGSDWPVVMLASNYRRWHEAAAALLPAATHAAVFGGTAVRFYGLSLGGPQGRPPYR